MKFDFKFEGFNKKIKHYYFFLDFVIGCPKSKRESYPQKAF